jgi:hypothetical protein
MIVMLEEPEAWSLMMLVSAVAVDNAELSNEGKEAIKRWRSSKMKLGGDDMQELMEKANEDFAKMFVRRERSAIQKHDWND